MCASRSFVNIFDIEKQRKRLIQNLSEQNVLYDNCTCKVTKSFAVERKNQIKSNPCNALLITHNPAAFSGSVASNSARTSFPVLTMSKAETPSKPKRSMAVTKAAIVNTMTKN